MIACTAMSTLLSPVQWLWAFSVMAQVAVFSLLFLNGSFRRLPLLTTYVGLNLCQAAFLLTLYTHLWARSGANVTLLGWSSEAATLFAQALATTEVLRLILRSYRGVWGLGWRLLSIVSMVVIMYTALDTWGNMGWAIIVADRGYHLTYATAVIACLLFIRYYAVPVPLVYKKLLAGFCFYSCTMILINTVGQAIWHPHDKETGAIWQAVSLLSFTAVQVVWAAALRKPLPGEEKQATLPSDFLYQRLSPEINERLGELNQKLLRLWKLEVRPQ